MSKDEKPTAGEFTLKTGGTNPGEQVKPGENPVTQKAGAEKAKPVKSKFNAVEEAILLAALSRIAYVLRPFPETVKSENIDETVKPEDIDAAITNLRQRGLVQGSQFEPNLTGSGIDAAQELAALTP